MDIIDLPWLEPEEPVGKALDRLIQLNSYGAIAAVTTRVAGVPKVIDAAGLIRAARADPQMLIADVDPVGPAVEMIVVAHAPYFGVEWALDAERADYGVDPGSGPLIRVATRHESLAEAFRIRAVVCRCDGPDQHPWSPGEREGLCFCGYPIVCP